jgi:hypothetical protein
LSSIVFAFRSFFLCENFVLLGLLIGLGICVLLSLSYRAYERRRYAKIGLLLPSVRLLYAQKSRTTSFSTIVTTFSWMSPFILIILYYVYFIKTSMTVEV